MAVALFDLDNTLLNGDSDHSWGEFLVSVGAVDAEVYTSKNEKFYADYEKGQLDIYEYSRFAFLVLQQYPLAQLQAWRTTFLQTIIKPMMTNKGQKLINTHKEKGDIVVIITATNSFITRPIADAFGVNQLIATEPAIIDGKYKAEIDGTPCYQEGKVIRLNAWLQEEKQNLDGSYFYSDSHNDIPLLKIVSRPVAVDPDTILMQVAIENRWEITSFRDNQ